MVKSCREHAAPAAFIDTEVIRYKMLLVGDQKAKTKKVQTKKHDNEKRNDKSKALPGNAVDDGDNTCSKPGAVTRP